MSRLELRGDLEAVAARLVAGRVDALAEQVVDEAKRRAPDAKAWMSQGDGRSRAAHSDAHGQTIPANLHYKLPKMVYVRKGRDADGRALNYAGGWKKTSGYDLARWPRDPALPDEQRRECRCESVRLRGLIARRITRTRARAEGPRATATVQVRFHRIAEAEFGTSRDVGVHFLSGAARAVAARLRTRH